MQFKLINLEDGDIFRILRFISLNNRLNMISQNKRLNYIALDNNKNLLFSNNNLNTITRLVKKIRSFNQFNDYIKITLTNDLKTEWILNYLE